MLKRLLKLSFLPSSHDWGLLSLRLGICISLFLKHGLQKVTRFSQMAQTFPDPLHMGATNSLIFALIADVICAWLMVVGFATRLCSIFAIVVITVAWGMVHHFAYFPHEADHGQVCWLYIAGLIPLAVAGAGRISIDHLIKD